MQEWDASFVIGIDRCIATSERGDDWHHSILERGVPIFLGVNDLVPKLGLIFGISRQMRRWVG